MSLRKKIEKLDLVRAGFYYLPKGNAGPFELWESQSTSEQYYLKGGDFVPVEGNYSSDVDLALADAALDATKVGRVKELSKSLTIHEWLNKYLNNDLVA